MIGAFSFIHDNRTYNCYPERQGEQGDVWWWFTVTHDQNRYAPFLAQSKDTRASTQARIVAYYANHLAHRQMSDRQHWARRDKPGLVKAVAAKTQKRKAS